MNRILVLYDSKSGNTAKMARHVAEGARSIPATEVRLKGVDEASAEDVRWADGLAAGSPTNFGTVSWRMKKFWDEVPAEDWLKIDGKIACAFSSSGGWGGGAELTCMTLLTMLMNYGFLVFGVTDYSGKIKTLHYGAVTAREPRSAEDIRGCRLLGKRLAEWVAVFSGGDRRQHPVLKRGKKSPK
jgi:NAD(P)H dehydrogenase (quinone)